MEFSGGIELARMSYAKFRWSKVPNVTNLQQHIFQHKI